MRTTSLGWALCLGLAGPAAARELAVSVVSPEGPLAEAVIWAEAADAQAEAEPRPAVMDQVKKAFLPYILPVQLGTTVDFPNSDPINHHVYSFSPAKRFELKLFKGEDLPHTMRFDKPGLVTLGCNIHDWMLGYILVLDTPWFAQTGQDGLAQLSLPERGRYTLKLWHPRVAESPDSLAQPAAGAAVEFRLGQALKPDPRQRAGSYER